MIYLMKSRNTEIISAKASEINVQVKKEDIEEMDVFFKIKK